MTYASVKRGIDVIIALLGLVLTAPVQLVLALLVRWRLGSPVLFRQERPGKDDEIFPLLKFRTMREVDERKGLISDADRMTRLGTLLRSTSLDELPSLLNVFKGDMSLVGPRPLLVQYLPLYTDEQRRRNQVRPGVTGLAQVSGRNSLDWDDKFRLDVEYVDTYSLRLDLKILALTALKVVKRDGISGAGSVTMTEFKG